MANRKTLPAVNQKVPIKFEILHFFFLLYKFQGCRIVKQSFWRKSISLNSTLIQWFYDDENPQIDVERNPKTSVSIKREAITFSLNQDGIALKKPKIFA